MSAYILKRLIHLIPVLFGVSVIVFVLMRVVPGDPISVYTQDQLLPEESIQQLRKSLGLDLPLPQQYVRYMGQLLRGDFGESLQYDQPVLSLIGDRLPATIELSIAALLLSLLLAIPIGILAAVFRGSIFDRIAIIISVLGVSLPTFWVGILLIYGVSLHLGWFSEFGRIDIGTTVPHVTGLYTVDSLLAGDFGAFRSALSHLVLPAVSIALSMQAFTLRLLRSSTIEALMSDYVVAARARGLSERAVVLRHAVRNALLPTITVIGLQIGGLVGGVIITETIFSWPGIGLLIVQAINSRDFVLVQGIVVVFAVVYVVLNLLTDLAYAWADPRIRLS
ncbi:MAG TPA: ABC transporter permease [Thermomicrobiales bacterium]|nr:ABC transporter permease [Thermomicrobiales bacterium]